MMAKLSVVYTSDKPSTVEGAYGDVYPPGYEFEIYRIWELQEDPPRLFKETGLGDSYGEVQWPPGEMIEVTRIAKVVTEYDFEEI